MLHATWGIPALTTETVRWKILALLKPGLFYKPQYTLKPVTGPWLTWTPDSVNLRFNLLHYDKVEQTRQVKHAVGKRDVRNLSQLDPFVFTTLYCSADQSTHPRGAFLTPWRHCLMRAGRSLWDIGMTTTAATTKKWVAGAGKRWNASSAPGHHA